MLSNACNYSQCEQPMLEFRKKNGNKPLPPKQKNAVAQNNVHFKKKFKIQK